MPKKRKKQPCPAKVGFVKVKEGDESSFVLRGCLTHNHEVEVPVVAGGKQFVSLEEAFGFVKEQELDSVYHMRDFKNNKNGSYAYFRCRRAGHHDAKKISSKKVGCKAFFTLRESGDGSTIFSIGEEHNHHQDDLKIMSEKERQKIKKQLESGVPVNTIIERIEAEDASERTLGKQVLIEDVRRLQRFYAPGSVNLNELEMTNVYKMLENKGFQKFSLRTMYTAQPIPPSAIRHKEIRGDPKIIYVSDEEGQIFKENPRSVFADSTHDTNRSGMLLASLMVTNSQGAGATVLQAYITSESEANLIPLFQTLKQMEPEAFSQINTLTHDMNNAWKNAFIKVNEGKEVNFVKCAFHVDQAWEKNMPASVLRRCKDLRLETDEKQFKIKYFAYQEIFLRGEESHKKAWNYFLANYGFEGSEAKPQEWAGCYNGGSVPHNIFIERSHRAYKARYFFRHFRMDQSLAALIKYNSHISYIEEAKRSGLRNMKPSVAQKRFSKSHKSPNGHELVTLSKGDTFCKKLARN